MTIESVLTAASVIPVLEVADLESAEPLAHALAAGGLRVAELTLRTPCALTALRVMQEAAPELRIGMGTICSAEDIRRSQEAGAAFLVSPGASPALLDALARAEVGALPGITTPSELLIAREHGFRAMKFFPAEAAGGIPYLKALGGPFPEVVFCPTGGITAEQASDYLALSNVACVGGSWIASKSMIQEKQWSLIQEHAQFACSLKQT